MAESGMTWQPIETAPKDGRHILACNAATRESAVVRWDEVSMDGKHGWQIAVAGSDWNFYAKLDGATHWIDLPKVDSSSDGMPQAVSGESEPQTPFTPQPLVVVDGIVRFRANAIVRYLLDEGPFDMNAIGSLPFSQADREQFAQLIGYSLGGFGNLSYVSDETYEAAARQKELL